MSPPEPARYPIRPAWRSELPAIREIEREAAQRFLDTQEAWIAEDPPAPEALLAERLEFDSSSRTLYAIGSVRFQRGQQYLQASRLRFSLLEGVGDMEDVYGVLDLDGSQQDLDLAQMPSAPLPPPEPLSCTPQLPPPPQWHPYPWAVTGWAGS